MPCAGIFGYSLSLSDVEELLAERGLAADYTTIWRWVQRYAPELEQRLRSHLKPTNKSWRVDETHLRVKGRWCYLYRAIDSTGATVDFLPSALRDAAAAKRLFRQALNDRSHPQPRVINTDQAPIYASAMADIKKEGTLRRRCRHRPVQYLNKHPGAGSSSDQTPGESQAALSRISSGAANDCGIRGDSHDPERAGAVGRWQRCLQAEPVHRHAVRSACPNLTTRVISTRIPPAFSKLQHYRLSAYPGPTPLLGRGTKGRQLSR